MAGRKEPSTHRGGYGFDWSENLKVKTLFHKKEIENLECFNCGKDLLHPPRGHLVFDTDWKEHQQIISRIRWICEPCDSLYRSPYKHWDWKNLSDLFMSDVLVQWILGVVVGLHTKKEIFSDEAMESVMKLLLIIFPHISKGMTPQQEKALKNLYEIPRFLGGLG